MWKQSAEMPQVYGQPLDAPHAGIQNRTASSIIF